MGSGDQTLSCSSQQQMYFDQLNHSFDLFFFKKTRRSGEGLTGVDRARIQIQTLLTPKCESTKIC